MPLNTETITTVRVTCDGPPCQQGTAGPRVVMWTQQPTDEHPTVPSEAWQLIVINLFDGSKFIFCGVDCARAWLRKHTALKSPAENVAENV